MVECSDFQKSGCSGGQPTLCSDVHSTLETFAGITSLHGVPRIINSRSMANRLFWSAVFVFAVFMFIYTGRNLLEQYFSYPKKVFIFHRFLNTLTLNHLLIPKVNVEIVQNPVPFPSVTLCNTDHLDFIVVEKLEKVFNTVEEDIKEENATSQSLRFLKT